MDFDLVTDIPHQGPALPSNLLFHLPHRRLTNDHHDDSSARGSTNRPATVISKIEAIFENIATCILDEKKELEIRIKTRGKQATKARDVATGTLKSLPNNETRSIRFPSKSPQEAWKFSRFGMVIVRDGCLLDNSCVAPNS